MSKIGSVAGAAADIGPATCNRFSAGGAGATQSSGDISA